MSSTIRKGGFQGSGDPGPPTKLMRPQVRPVGAPPIDTRPLRTLQELERDRVPYLYKGMPVLVPRVAHDEIERLQAENERLRQERR